MDLQALNSGTVASKNWLRPVCGHITAGTLTADTVDFDSIETNYLTLVEQKAVPNPAVGSQTLFIDGGTGLLNTQDSAGVSIPYLQTTGGAMTGLLNMTNNIISGIRSLASFATNIIWGTGATATGNDGIAIGNSASVTGGNCVAIGRNSTAITSDSLSIGHVALGAHSNQTIVGCNCGATNWQYACAFGQNAISDAFAALTFSSGNSVCTNSTANSVLFGDSAMVNLRSDSAACTLGTAAKPFRVAYLRDAAPAVGCKYSQYGAVTVTNTVVDTSLATGTSVGSLVASANATVGTVYKFVLGLSWTGTVADTAIIRLKTNGAPLVAITMGPENVATTATLIKGTIVVAGGGNAQCELRYIIGGLVSDITNATSAYNPAVANTFDVSVEWSAADVGDVLTCNFLYVESLFAQ
jgi:hypothetical protein